MEYSYNRKKSIYNSFLRLAYYNLTNCSIFDPTKGSCTFKGPSFLWKFIVFKPATVLIRDPLLKLCSIFAFKEKVSVFRLYFLEPFTVEQLL